MTSRGEGRPYHDASGAAGGYGDRDTAPEITVDTNGLHTHNGPMSPSSHTNRPANQRSDRSYNAEQLASNGVDDVDKGVKDMTVRDRARTNGGSSKSRVCMKCGESLTGQFVRALGGTFHLDCFRCEDCGDVVASKFFPVDDENGGGQYPLCETDYFRRLNLLCHKCGGALRGSYVTALDHKYHVDHFSCSVCPTTFGASDSYYEHEGQVYCHYHYSTRFAQRCHGCQTAILKQFVEIFKNGQNQHWHPECYMIHKYWNVNLATSRRGGIEKPESEEDASEETRTLIREEEERMEERVYRIWSTLSAFEESSAACISDMLLHVSNGAYVDGVLVAKKFILHVDILFGATDRLDHCISSHGFRGLTYGREAKLLCKKIVAFFALLSKTQDGGVRRLGVTQELLSLVTSLAHYLKLLIRISLQGALKLEKEKNDTNGLRDFLEELAHLEVVKDTETTLEYGNGDGGLAKEHSDWCFQCNEPIDDACFRMGDRRWHSNHLVCQICHTNLAETQELEGAVFVEGEKRLYCSHCAKESFPSGPTIVGVERVTRLQQYVFLLRVALARLLAVLRSGGALPHTSDDPNLNSYDSSDGHRLGLPTDRNLLSSTRSKSYTGALGENEPSSYAQTVGEMKRLRSTRMDKHLSASIKKARTSRLIDDSQAQNLNTELDKSGNKNNGVTFADEQDLKSPLNTALTFSNQDALTLDDIPRIVAAEQAKEQRPNAHRFARNQLLSGGRQPKLLNVQSHDVTSGVDADRPGATDYYPSQKNKRYFSELSALEYFIVRHLAVISMQPLLEGHFNLEELLSLIESRKTTFWNKFGRAFKNDKAKAGKKKGVFGVGLDTLVEREGVESTDGVGPGALRVPSLLDDTISAMRQMDMSVEGVFRKNGNIRGLKDLAERLDAKEGEVDLHKESPVQIAALLKKFLRELPDPLLTYKLHSLFTTSQKIADEEKRRRVLHLTCCLLPKAHRDSAEILFCFLNWTASFSQVDEEVGSKMDSHNLATVITPNILKQAETGGKSAPVDDSFLAIEAVHMLIDYNDQMCEVPEDLQSLLADQSLFANTSDITTKEILKRYGDVASKTPSTTNSTPSTSHPNPTSLSSDTVTNSQSQLPFSPQGDTFSSPSPNSHSRNKDSSGNARTAAPQRIESDPKQASAWQKESSVRHVQGNGSAMTPGQPGREGQSPTVRFDFPGRDYHQRAGSAESAASFKAGAGRNGVGVAGAG